MTEPPHHEPEPDPTTPDPDADTQAPNSAFLHHARELGPVVAALAFLSLTVPGLLGTIVLATAIFNSGTPANFYDPDQPRHHRLLGTWHTSIPLDPAIAASDDYTTINLALRAADPKATDADAAIAHPINAKEPQGLPEDATWQPYPETPLTAGATSLSLPSQDEALPSIALTLQPADDPTDDTLTGTFTSPDDESAVEFTAERRVPLIQRWIIDLGFITAAIAVALLFAFATGSALLPTYALSFAVGVFFGPVYGSAVAMFGVTAGALVGYTWAALLARKRVSLVIERNPRAALVRNAILNKPLLQEVFVVILLRFPPNSPFALTNLAMSSVGVRLIPYTLGTCIGIAPRTLFAVYLGVAINNIADAQTAGGALRIAIGITIGIAVFVLVYRILSKWAREALQNATATAPSSGDRPGDPPAS